MPIEHRVCSGCPQAGLKQGTFGFTCKTRGLPVTTKKFFGFHLAATPGEYSNYFECVRAFGHSGMQKTLKALEVARGGMKPEKGMAFRKDGSVEFASSWPGCNKLRRVYPDGRVFVKAKRWELLGTINERKDI